MDASSPTHHAVDEQTLTKNPVFILPFPVLRQGKQMARSVKVSLYVTFGLGIIDIGVCLGLRFLLVQLTLSTITLAALNVVPGAHHFESIGSMRRYSSRVEQHGNSTFSPNAEVERDPYLVPKAEWILRDEEETRLGFATRQVLLRTFQERCSRKPTYSVVLTIARGQHRRGTVQHLDQIQRLHRVTGDAGGTDGGSLGQADPGRPGGDRVSSMPASEMLQPVAKFLSKSRRGVSQDGSGRRVLTSARGLQF
ncbi:hypothetical protein GGTG_09092 [Gaeumannomyces tritici R3-111a-1]|uniref:Uncharacterized protein n=1 Tax=Gaeumannomyces tritici (strain R3-111a-1) TaxID=644352 RepID=J3P6F2_GAET3|nr:hypothetical protein GGTG_09092 [Gaeumannomyces tritici R3-111a-1]EJT72226.1 hypothetical protein GGTG_09092 [Gaeumannomyces tritici R3-111a-1]